MAGYNQVSIRTSDKLKTTFTTGWGRVAFNRISFGVCNASRAFQRLMMDIFKDFLCYFLEVFIDDLAVFGNPKVHPEHLHRTFY